MSDPDAPSLTNFAGSSPITSVTFRLRPEDVRAFQSALRPRIVTAILYVVATLTVVLLITSLVLHVRRFGFDHPEVFRSGGILIFMVVVGAGTILWQKLHKGAESPVEIKVDLTPESLNVGQAGVSETKHAWTSVAEIRETPRHFLVYLEIFNPINRREKPMLAFLIPRRAFATAEAADEFLRTATEWHAAAVEAAEV